VPRKLFWGYSGRADAAAERAVELLSAAGATVVDNTDLVSMVDFDQDDELTVLLAEFRTGLAAYLSSRPGDGPRTLEEVVEFNRRHADVELAHFGQSLFEMALEGPEDGSESYADARARCVDHARVRGIDEVLRTDHLDAFVTPSYPPAMPIDLVNAEHMDGGCTQPSAMAGYPIVTVPSGLAGGLPVAVSFWGTAGSERTLIEIAHGYERARDADTGRLPVPTFAPFV
jgi:amidase